MISITCTNCKTVIEMDDAFAGGVCRCRHCGTIQTVPSKLRSMAAASPGPADSVSGSKTLYQKTQTAVPNSPLSERSDRMDQLADVVASSGLHSGRLLKGKPPAAKDAPPGQKKTPLVPLLAASTAVIIVLVAVVAWLLLRGNGAAPATGENGAGGVPSVAGGGDSPAFCGISLESPSVIYLLDRGNSVQENFDPLKAATLRSIESLGGSRKFQIIFWNNGGDDAAYPAGAMQAATSDEVAACRTSIEEIPAQGSSRLQPALELALSHKPATIVIATAKSKLDSEDMRALKSAESRGVKINAVLLGEGAENAALDEAANATGGQYKSVSGPQLRSFSQ